MTKLLFDYQIFAGQEYGGISRYFVEMASRFPELDPSFSFSFLAPMYRNRHLHEAADHLPVHGVYCPRLPLLGRAMRHSSAALFRLLARPKEGILHQTYFWEGPKARSHWRGPVFLTVYDMIHEKFPEYYSPHDPTARQKAAAVKAADHLFCISEQTKKDLIEILDVPSEKISVTYLSHSLPESSEERKLPAAIQKPFLLFVGPRSGYKNFSALIQAYLRAPDLQKDLQIVCLGGGAFSTEELTLLASLPQGAEKVVQLNGDDKTLRLLYAKATVFVYPSLYEGFGIPVLEAMASSCAVVCGHGGSLEEVAGRSAALCDQKNPDSLLEAIRSVVYDETTKRKTIEAGRIRAREFSWRRCAEETLQAYRKYL